MTFIRMTPERLWEALTDPQFGRKYWFGSTVECGWKKGSAWKLVGSNGSLTDTGEILEIDPPRRMVIRWQNEWKPELKAEGPSRCTMELKPVGSAVKLTVTHEIERPDSKLITAVSGGRPRVRSFEGSREGRWASLLVDFKSGWGNGDRRTRSVLRGTGRSPPEF